MDFNKIINMVDVKVKNDILDFSFTSIPSVGFSDSVFLVDDRLNDIVELYTWDSLHHKLWELWDLDLLEEHDCVPVRKITINVNLEP